MWLQRRGSQHGVHEPLGIHLRLETEHVFIYCLFLDMCLYISEILFSKIIICLLLNILPLSSGESRIIFLPERSSICQYPCKNSATNVKKQSRARLLLTLYCTF